MIQELQRYLSITNDDRYKMLLPFLSYYFQVTPEILVQWALGTRYSSHEEVSCKDGHIKYNETNLQYKP